MKTIAYQQGEVIYTCSAMCSFPDPLQGARSPLNCTEQKHPIHISFFYYTKFLYCQEKNNHNDSKCKIVNFPRHSYSLWQENIDYNHDELKTTLPK